MVLRPSEIAHSRIAHLIFTLGSRKNPNSGEGVENMEFPGLSNIMWNFQGLIKNEVEFPIGDQEKIMLNFHGSLFLALYLYLFLDETLKVHKITK